MYELFVMALVIVSMINGQEASSSVNTKREFVAKRPNYGPIHNPINGPLSPNAISTSKVPSGPPSLMKALECSTRALPVGICNSPSSCCCNCLSGPENTQFPMLKDAQVCMGGASSPCCQVCYDSNYCGGGKCNGYCTSFCGIDLADIGALSPNASLRYKDLWNVASENHDE